MLGLEFFRVRVVEVCLSWVIQGCGVECGPGDLLWVLGGLNVDETVVDFRSYCA